ncbi:hypothetical protein SUGI_0537540 [Cryptomeria japonica]|uniref:uncharacterized protein LOC131079374 n=1 Tax=Cryptomeria japonica TaxID=3369 RepID=UPI002408C375|nr:uncharacterized protein LOC131079374 [Cryptomeria japonica]GLJ27390.1 hypothetical protein SUGI_0537540 [Cryptomeria japonica]
MRILSWNVRGLGAPDKHRMVKHHLGKANCDTVMLQETKCGLTEGENFIKYCRSWIGSFQVVEGLSGGLGILWNPNKVNIKIMGKSKHWISDHVQSKISSTSFPLWNIYGPTQSPDKSKLWELNEQISLFGSNNYIIGGDFNVILDLSEKKGGTNKISRDMVGFRDFIQGIEAVVCIPSEGWFTWTNKRLGFTNIVEHMDRFLTGSRWMMEGMPIIAKTLAYCLSDHFPIMLEMGSETRWGGGYFKFQNMW